MRYAPSGSNEIATSTAWVAFCMLPYDTEEEVVFFGALLQTFPAPGVMDLGR
jgi:hypothetical protein